MSFKEIRIGDYALRFYPSDNGWMCGITPSMMEALEQAEKQEPVAWIEHIAGGVEYSPYHQVATKLPEGVKFDLYTYPPAAQWVGLTDEEKEQATGWSVEHIEQALKEKNT